MRTSISLLFLVLSLVACSPWKVRYEPRTAVVVAPTARKATRFLPEESRKLVQAGGKALGALEIEGSGIVAERLEDLHNKAREEAARHGGTHFLHLDAKLGDAELGAINEAFGAALKPTDLLSGSKKALYLVVAVPQEGWARLPQELQPIP